MKAALSWFFLHYLFLTHLQTQVVKADKKKGDKKPHTYWTHAQLIEMLALPEDPQRQDYKMELAGWLMYELAMRTQDAILLTFGHFS